MSAFSPRLFVFSAQQLTGISASPRISQEPRPAASPARAVYSNLTPPGKGQAGREMGGRLPGKRNSRECSEQLEQQGGSVLAQGSGGVTSEGGCPH